jgi:hypothetical protein
MCFSGLSYKGEDDLSCKRGLVGEGWKKNKKYKGREKKSE